MKFAVWCMLAALSASGTTFAQEDAVAAGESTAPLIVHEWGTFTSFSGSDGVKLEYRPLLANDLPPFVDSRERQLSRWLGKGNLRAIQRLETPVTYFYTPVERDVTVNVRFPGGLLTEFYPPPRTVAPEVRMTFDLSEQDFRFDSVTNASTSLPRDSLLDWGKVHLIPRSALRTRIQDAALAGRMAELVEQGLVPEASAFLHYAAARETESAIVQVTHSPADQPQTPHVFPGNYFEKFLFYRGVGNFELPLSIVENPPGNFQLRHSGKEVLPAAIFVEVQGGTLTFAVKRSLPPGSSTILRAEGDNADVLVYSGDLSTASLQALQAAMVEELVRAGLYEQEASAMVACWEASWFAEEGTRVLTVIPQSWTDRVLPLEIHPVPDQTVRVMVGRLEILPRQTEARLLESVLASAQNRGRGGAASPTALTELESLGRMAEPALVRIRHIATDVLTKREAETLLQELRSKTSEGGNSQ